MCDLDKILSDLKADQVRLDALIAQDQAGLDKLLEAARADDARVSELLRSLDTAPALLAICPTCGQPLPTPPAAQPLARKPSARRARSRHSPKSTAEVQLSQEKR